MTHSDAVAPPSLAIPSLAIPACASSSCASFCRAIPDVAPALIRPAPALPAGAETGSARLWGPRPESLPRRGRPGLGPGLSVVIPTLNAAATLPGCLYRLAEGLASGVVAEIIVSDGGSSDGTPILARRSGARVLRTPKGRGAQLRAGMAAAGNPWLLALHADTRLEIGWSRHVAAFCGMADAPARAAAFRFALLDQSPEARRLERLVAWRCRRLGLPYGDQGLLISRGLYEQLGGYRPLPLMEDVDLVRRLGRHRLTLLPVRAFTAADRFQRDGYRRRSARNLACLTLWRLGLPIRWIQRLYG